MIHSANHSSYPVGDDDPRDEATEAIVVAEQSRAFLDVVTDGQVRWPDLRGHCVACLDGELRRVAPMAVPGYLAASAVTPKPVKVSLPGAVALGGERHRAAAEALAEEVRELGAAGCRWFQVEERAEDASASIPVLEAAPAGSVTILWVGRPDSGGLAALPGTHLGLDATDAAVLELLPHLPPGRGVALGLFDAGREDVEDADEVAARLAPFREALAGRNVIVGPNGGLAALPRDVAFEKLLQARYLAEGLRRRWSVSVSRR